ncbi:MAG TPA: hypothetical protein VF337_03775 [Candidatus Limnocylindrales bacterium]
MGVLMDLVAGDAREILLAISVDDWAGLRDRRRFHAYISLGGGMDPTWLDLFARAVREVMDSASPGAFGDAACPLESRLQSRLSHLGDRTVERVAPHWIEEVAVLPGDRVDRTAARWIELIDAEVCKVEPEEKPMLRALTGDLIDFCRAAADAEDVLFAWSI